MKREETQYDMQKKNKAVTGLVFRAAVLVYLLYLAGKILKSAAIEGGSIPLWAAAVIAAVFAAAAVGFGLYAWKQYRIALADAQLPPQETDAPDGGDAAQK